MADRYWVGGGANTNWATAGNWSASSGGAGGATVPTSADNVFFTGVGVNSNGTSTIGTATTILSLSITAGFTGTIAHNFALTIVTNVTLGANYNITGGAALTISGTSNMTSNGRTWPGSLSFTGTATKTLVDNWTVTGLVSNNGTTTLNGNTLYMGSSLSMTGGGLVAGGTTLLIFQGTGTWSGPGVVNNNLTFGGTCLITLSGSVQYGSGTFTHVVGSMITTGATISFTGSTYNSPGTFWDNVNVTGTMTLYSTLSAYEMTLMGNVTFAGTHAISVSFLYNNQAGTAATITFQEGLYYYIEQGFFGYQTRIGAILHFTSSSATNRAFFTLLSDTEINLLASFTRMEAIGRPVRTFNGTVTDCINIFEFHDIPTMAATF